MFYLKTCKIVYDTCICIKSITDSICTNFKITIHLERKSAKWGGLSFIYDISLNDKSPKEITKCWPLNLHGDTCVFEIFIFFKCPEVQFGGIF